jgi:hypothetical protein
MRRGATAARNSIAAALAVAVSAGYLLSSGALDPVLNDVLTRALGRNDADAGTALNAVPVTDWMYFDDRPEWSTLRRIPALPSSPDQPIEPGRPVVAPPENPHRWQFNGPAPMPHYSLKPMESCPQPHGQEMSVARLTAIAGTKSATVTWWDLGDPDTRTYQIAVVAVGATGNPVGYSDSSTATEPVRYVYITAPNTCRQVSVVIGGLKTGDAYRFWLMATNQSRVQKNRNYRHGRGETETVTIN